MQAALNTPQNNEDNKVSNKKNLKYNFKADQNRWFGLILPQYRNGHYYYYYYFKRKGTRARASPQHTHLFCVI